MAYSQGDLVVQPGGLGCGRRGKREFFSLGIPAPPESAIIHGMGNNSDIGNRLKVYLETSFISYLTGDATANAKIAADQAYTRLWWERERPKCDVFVSAYTAAEAANGREVSAKRRIAAINGIPLVTVDDDAVIALANKLLDAHALPPGETTDALHIASASVGGTDVLLTWNCRHMANPHTLPRTKEIVRTAGYHCPDIMTPKTFIENTELETSYV